MRLHPIEPETLPVHDESAASPTAAPTGQHESAARLSPHRTAARTRHRPTSARADCRPTPAPAVARPAKRPRSFAGAPPSAARAPPTTAARPHIIAVRAPPRPTTPLSHTGGPTRGSHWGRGPSWCAQMRRRLCLVSPSLLSSCRPRRRHPKARKEGNDGPTGAGTRVGSLGLAVGVYPCRRYGQPVGTWSCPPRLEWEAEQRRKWEDDCLRRQGLLDRALRQALACCRPGATKLAPGVSFLPGHESIGRTGNAEHHTVRIGGARIPPGQEPPQGMPLHKRHVDPRRPCASCSVLDCPFCCPDACV